MQVQVVQVVILQIVVAMVLVLQQGMAVVVFNIPCMDFLGFIMVVVVVVQFKIQGEQGEMEV
jgi:hypothetical protein